MIEEIDNLIMELDNIKYPDYKRLDDWKNKVESFLLGFPEDKFYWIDKFRDIKYRREHYGISIEVDPQASAFKKGKIQAISLLHRAREKLLELFPISKSKKVFVAHGRNLKIRDAMFAFLYAIKLEPIEWEEGVRLTGKGAPYNSEILETMFSVAQAIIVLFTPDDEVRLKEEFQSSFDPPSEKKFIGQARPNVIFEAGMAFGKNSDRTILVRVGELRPISNLEGHNYVNLKNDEESRKKLAGRLQTVKCDLNLEGNDWLTIGDFSLDNRKITSSSRFRKSIVKDTISPKVLPQKYNHRELIESLKKMSKGQISDLIIEMDYPNLKTVARKIIAEISLIDDNDEYHEKEQLYDFIIFSIIIADREDVKIELFRLIFTKVFSLDSKYMGYFNENIYNIIKIPCIQEYIINNNLLDQIIQFFINSYSYKSAGNTAEILLLFIEQISLNQINKIAEGTTNNNQIYESTKAIRNINKIFSRYLINIHPDLVDKLSELNII